MKELLCRLFGHQYDLIATEQNGLIHIVECKRCGHRMSLRQRNW